MNAKQGSHDAFSSSLLKSLSSFSSPPMAFQNAFVTCKEWNVENKERNIKKDWG
jgi:hypothetical protein